MSRHNAICVALDTPDLARARDLARALNEHVGYIKLGMEFFYSHGPRGYEIVAAEGVPVFLDLKLHDIPNTVGSAMAALMRLEPRPAIVNVHAAGGRDMMEAARDAVDGRVELIAITILTSLADEDLELIGFDPSEDSKGHALALAQLAQASGLSGVVCSPREVEAIRHARGEDFLLVVPGIRPSNTGVHDQKRTATPESAFAAGADILVIGRAITEAPDPVRAVELIAENLHAG